MKKENEEDGRQHHLINWGEIDQYRKKSIYNRYEGYRKPYVTVFNKHVRKYKPCIHQAPYLFSYRCDGKRNVTGIE